MRPMPTSASPIPRMRSEPRVIRMQASSTRMMRPIGSVLAVVGGPIDLAGAEFAFQFELIREVGSGERVREAFVVDVDCRRWGRVWRVCVPHE